MNFMASLTSIHHLTAEQYAQLDEVPGFRDELIEGERVLSPFAVFRHAEVIKQLEDILEGQLASLSDEPLKVVRETGWKFHNSLSGVDSVPGPDLMVIREDDRRAVKIGGWFEGTPLIVIEVISPSERKARRLQKVGLYLDMGVPYVLEADYTKRTIRLYTPDSELTVVHRADDQLLVPFKASINEIFSVLD